ncbi:hypothetical protein AAFF_G00310940 [Aldrovandia affinis]|uniref:G-protein coupled receptors family 1 profile domain-containing protein n=1 Tax=Aldrovandia affinis TaxID=143900 RepID=A0AAD7R8C9_9TELE|nr:hypothetical protein AAFF_G00310940 [Aldrovandia affinis]
MDWLPAHAPRAPNATAGTAPPLAGERAAVVAPPLAAERAAVVALLAGLALLTAVLNAGVMATICLTRKLRLPAYYLICSLAFADLLVAVLVMPPSVAYVALGAWPLGRTACEAWLSVDMTCCTCSILHLCAIALDRYCSITAPARYQRTARRAGAMVAGVWTLSALIAVPPLFWRRSHGDPGPAPDSHCVIGHEHLGYTLYSVFGAFYARWPSCWGCTAASTPRPRPCTARGPPAPGPELPLLRLPAGPAAVGTAPWRERLRSSRERRAARTLGLILGAFVLCWLPFFLKELLVGLRLLRDSATLSSALTWLGYVNSLVNPLLYTSFNEDFQRAFRTMLGRRGRG